MIAAHHIRRLFLIWLTALAGYANLFCLMHFNRVVTHYTGTVTQWVLALIQGEVPLFLTLTALIFCFFGGALLAGYLFCEPNERRKTHECYIYLFAAMGLIFLTTWAHQSAFFPLFVASMMGLQNGIQHRERDLLFRTTHLTGTLTDLGVLLGKRLRREPANPHLAPLLLIQLCSFATGAGLAGWAYHHHAQGAGYGLCLGYLIAAVLRHYSPLHEALKARVVAEDPPSGA